MQKRLTTIASAAAIAIATVTPLAAQAVKPARSNIAEENFQTEIVMEGLRQLGFQVAEPVEMQIQLAHVAVANNDATFYAAHWSPLHDAFAKEAGGEAKLMRLGKLTSDSLQGYLIDKKTATEKGITKLDQLKDPALAKLFDVDGNGKADLYGCEPGWGCERVIEHQLTAFGLRNSVEHKQGGYFAIIPDAIERIKAGKPTLYYTWTPLWVSGVLRPGQEVVWLNVEKTSLPDGKTDNTTAQGLGNLGFPVNDQFVIANSAFLKANPKAKKFFELVNVPIGDINSQNLLMNKGEKSAADVKRHAGDWIKKTQANWDKWIAEAKAAN